MPTARRSILLCRATIWNNQRVDAARLIVFRLFILALAVWTGAGTFEAIRGHAAWYADPLAYVSGSRSGPAVMNPWPLLTVILVLTMLATAVLFLPGGSPGRREALITAAGVLLVLIPTFLYFVPQLTRMFGRSAALSDAELIAASRDWVRWNIVRIIYLLGLTYYGLIALGRTAGASQHD